MDEWSIEADQQKEHLVDGRAYEFVRSLALPTKYSVTEKSFSCLPISTQSDCRRMWRELSEDDSADVSRLCSFALWATWFSAAKSVFSFSAHDESSPAHVPDDFLSSPKNYLKFNGQAITLFEQLMPDTEPEGRQKIRRDLGLTNRPRVDSVLKAFSLYLYAEVSRNSSALNGHDAINLTNEASKANALASEYVSFVISMSKEPNSERDEQIARQALAREGGWAKSDKNLPAKNFLVSEWAKLKAERSKNLSFPVLSKTGFAKKYASIVKTKFPNSEATERTIRSWI